MLRTELTMSTLLSTSILAVAITLPSLNPLTLFGLFAVTAMLVCYALEKRSNWFILAFAVSCLLGSAYGFLQGAWPFGLVEGIWAVVAARRWWQTSG
jgi:hypothetical protein